MSTRVLCALRSPLDELVDVPEAMQTMSVLVDPGRWDGGTMGWDGSHWIAVAVAVAVAVAADASKGSGGEW
jgi:hypothetical protein